MMSLLVQLLSGWLCAEAGKCQPGYFLDWHGVNDDGPTRHTASSKWISQFRGEGLGFHGTYAADIVFVSPGMRIQRSHI